MIVRFPAASADVENCAWLPDSPIVPWGTPSTRKTTVPVGVPDPGGVAETVAVNVTAWPNTDGFADDSTTMERRRLGDGLGEGPARAGRERRVTQVRRRDRVGPRRQVQLQVRGLPGRQQNGAQHRRPVPEGHPPRREAPQWTSRSP